MLWKVYFSTNYSSINTDMILKKINIHQNISMDHNLNAFKKYYKNVIILKEMTEHSLQIDYIMRDWI